MNTTIYRKYLLYAVVAFLSMTAVSCSDEPTALYSESGTKAVLPEVASYSGGGNIADDNENKDINVLHACLFEDGVMTQVFEDIDPSQGLKLNVNKGRLYMVANLDAPAAMLRSVGMSEEEWLSMRILHKGGKNLDYMSGVVNLSDASNGTLLLNRGVARIDICVGQGIAIKDMYFKNIAQQSFLNKQPSVVSPEGTGINDVHVALDSPITESRPGIAYLCEQASDDISSVLTVEVGGETVVKEVAMPSALKRNAVYTINVFKASVEADVILSVTDWENGGGFDVAPNQGGLTVDAENTDFPYGTKVDATRKSIVLPHREADFVLSIDCDDELEFIPDPLLPMSVERINDAGAVGKNMFRITKGIWRPGMEEVKRKLMFHRKGLGENYPDDGIEVLMSANPVKVQGMFHFVDGTEYDFGKYIDNELGRLTVPAHKSVAMEYEEGEGEWVKLEETENGVLRVFAGWRPNDVTANGRVQKARIVITNKADGSEREEYTIARRNWGLPVTKLNGVWWCKYNAKGNSKDFSDQILSSDDPAAKAGKTVYDYLRDCSAEEYFDLWKWQYQGHTSQGMQVIDDNGVAKLEGYGPSDVHINKNDPKALAPDGYELPTLENFNRIFEAPDYVWIMWDGSHTSPWNGGTNIQRRQRRRNDVSVGTVALPDLIYISMYSPSQPEYESIVWYGSSAQWNSDGIKHGHYNNMLWAMHSEAGTGWYFNGSMAGLYLTKNGAGNNDSRLVRFKKSDVEYIY